MRWLKAEFNVLYTIITLTIEAQDDYKFHTKQNGSSAHEESFPHYKIIWYFSSWMI